MGLLYMEHNFVCGCRDNRAQEVCFKQPCIFYELTLWALWILLDGVWMGTVKEEAGVEEYGGKEGLAGMRLRCVTGILVIKQKSV